MRNSAVSCALICIAVSAFKVQCDFISRKLDFGNDNAKLEDTGDDSVTTVICINDGCNKTETKNDELLTDIVVHVKTSQKGIKSNKTIEDTPDVPVVVGSSTSPSTILSDNLLNSNIAPNYKDVINENLFIPSLPTIPKQYYGEQPPQHFVWYPKGGAAYNPVEFKNFQRPTWHRAQYGQHFQRRVSPGYTTCMCQNPGLGWYPTTPTFNLHYRRNDGIDDKLGELN